MSEERGFGEQSTLMAGDGLDGTPEPGLADDVVLAAQQAKVFGALFRKPVLRRFGRYVVLDVLGQGGMGVVLKGYDEELDRQVAIKVLHRELDAQHTARLRREAQAMAKLSHPNVVQVYEVGELEGQTFVAMELVKGQTVRAWMDREPRPGWKACVELFLQLGEGLAAAHKRGLVHRDFKPGNAIVDEEGRARVLDFGLARQGDQREEEQDEAPSVIQRARTDAQQVVPLEQALTRTGAVLGTPAYMPVEQMSGRPADARSDQFSFCVALYEAVYGERPYEGSSMMALMVSMRAGAVRSAPKGSDVPLALRKVLLRGLAVEPEERWPTMEVLLAELRRLVTPRGRRFAIASLAVTVLGLGGSWAFGQYVQIKDRCTGAEAKLASVWGDTRKQEVKAAILGTGLSYAPGTWDRVEQRLDAYTEDWSSKHVEVCEATSVRNEQSAEVMDLRMGCLAKRRGELRAAVGVLAEADETVVENAVKLVAGLPGFGRCDDVEALRAEVPPPEDPAVAQQVAVLDERLEDAKALEDAGKYEDGLRLADEVVMEGGGLDYMPLMARAWLRQGSLRERTGDYEGAVEVLKQAYGAAVIHSMKAEAANASAVLVHVLGIRLTRHEEARGWAEHADPLSQAAGTDEACARYFQSLGAVAYSQSKLDEARALYERALAIKEKAGPDHPHVASSLSNLGSVADSQGKLDEARALHERALAIQEKALGPDHPDVAASLHNLGGVTYSQGKLDEARALFERALVIQEKALGPDHPHVARSLTGLGAAASSQGKLDEARTLFERALVIQEKASGPDHPDVAGLLDNLGNVASAQGKLDEARALYERALAIKEKALGPDHPDVANSLNNLGVLASAQGKLDEARALYERALAIWEKALGHDHPNLANSLNNLGDVADSQGKLDEARALYERALAVWEKALGHDHPNVAQSLHNLGALASSQGKLDEARALYERALAIWEKALGPDHPNVAASLNNLGNVADSQGKLDEARALYERALAIWEKALGHEHPDVAYPLGGLANVALAQHRPAEALPLAERALAIREKAGVPVPLLATTRFTLARALWTAPTTQGRDRPRARSLAEQARDAYASLGDAEKTNLTEVQAWLTDHRLP